MENQRKIKSFGKVLYVLAIIARVCLYMASVVLVLFAIVVPILFSKVRMEKDKISIVGIPDAKVEVYKDKKSDLNITINGRKIDTDKELSKTERLSAEVVFDMLSNTTKESVIVYLEASTVFSLVSIILVLLAVKNFEKFSMNLKDKDEVFILVNSIYLRKMAKFLLIPYIVTLIASGAINGAFTDSFNINYNTMNLVEIIALYMLSYIFAYGNTLELKKQETAEVKEIKPKTPRKRTSKKAEEK